MGADHLQTFLVHVFRHYHSFSLVSKLEEDAFLRRVLVLHKGSFHITHAFSALVSFGSDDLKESLPRKANSQFGSSLHGRWTRVEPIDELLSSPCCWCSDWMLKISSSVCHQEELRSRKKFTWTADISRDRKSSSLCCCCSDCMLGISSSVRNNLVSFDWLRTEADYLLILTYLLTYLLNINTMA